jgi:hypothetical protein
MIASASEWFSHSSSDVVHIYRELDESCHPIPVCRCASKVKTAPGSCLPSEVIRQPKGFAIPPEQTYSGLSLIHIMRMRIHKSCLAKVSLAVAAILSQNPP